MVQGHLEHLKWTPPDATSGILQEPICPEQISAKTSTKAISYRAALRLAYFQETNLSPEGEHRSLH